MRHDSRQPRGREASDAIRERLGALGSLGSLGGLADLIGKLADFAESAESAAKEGSFQTTDGREGRFRVGFNVRTLEDAGGQTRYAVEPFGDVARDRATGEARVSETREPPVDVFEEEGHVLVVVEMPGVERDSAAIRLEDDVLTIEAAGAGKRYRKETLLPAGLDPGSMRVTANSGVFEIRIDLVEG